MPSHTWSGAAGAEAPADSLEDVMEESREWAAAFAQLHNAARPEPDPVPEVKDTRQNLAAALARLSQVEPEHPCALHTNPPSQVLCSMQRLVVDRLGLQR